MSKNTAVIAHAGPSVLVASIAVQIEDNADRLHLWRLKEIIAEARVQCASLGIGNSNFGNEVEEAVRDALPKAIALLSFRGTYMIKTLTRVVAEGVDANDPIISAAGPAVLAAFLAVELEKMSDRDRFESMEPMLEKARELCPSLGIRNNKFSDRVVEEALAVALREAIGFVAWRGTHTVKFLSSTVARAVARGSET